MSESPDGHVRVLGLVPALLDTSPGQRYRIEQWRPTLEAEGLDVTLLPFETEELHAILYERGHAPRKAAAVLASFARRARHVLHAGDFDVVYLYREASIIGPAILERFAARQVPIVFDFDDAIYLRQPSVANGYLSLLKLSGKTRSICRMARHVMVGNAHLAEYACRYNSSVSVVPSTIDLTCYTYAEPAPRRHGSVVIGWTGSHSTVPHLHSVRASLSRLAALEDVRFKVIGAPDYELPGVPIEALSWSSDTEVEDLRDFDIGIMPLPDDEWTRGKCAAKALQYMGLGIPVVCSPVGVNADIVTDGHNGLLATTEDEWVAALTRLVRDRELRLRIGRAGRSTVVDHFDGRVHGRRVARILRDAADASR